MESAGGSPGIEVAELVFVDHEDGAVLAKAVKFARRPVKDAAIGASQQPNGQPKGKK